MDHPGVLMPMTDIYTLKVPGMTCGHCVQTVERGARAVPGVADARVDLRTKTLTVQASEPGTRERVTAAVARSGYKVEA